MGQGLDLAEPVSIGPREEATQIPLKTDLGPLMSGAKTLDSLALSGHLRPSGLDISSSFGPDKSQLPQPRAPSRSLAGELEEASSPTATVEAFRRCDHIPAGKEVIFDEDLRPADNPRSSLHLQKAGELSSPMERVPNSLNRAKREDSALSHHGRGRPGTLSSQGVEVLVSPHGTKLPNKEEELDAPEEMETGVSDGELEAAQGWVRISKRKGARCGGGFGPQFPLRSTLCLAMIVSFWKHSWGLHRKLQRSRKTKERPVWGSWMI